MKTFAIAALTATTSALDKLPTLECPSDIPTVNGFDGSLYAGIWYENERQVSPMPTWMGGRYSPMADMGKCGLTKIEDEEEGLYAQF